MIRSFRIALALTLIAAAPTAATRAQELTATTTLDTFSSPGDLYGPWQTTLLEDQWQAGAKDVPSITLLDRTDRDRNTLGDAAPTHSTAVYADDYHTWSNSFFTYAQVMTSSGQILPNRLAYLEGDVKFGRRRNLVVGTGASLYANPDGSVTHGFSFGPTLYTGSMVYTVRVLPTVVNGRYTGLTSNGTAVSGANSANGTALEAVAEYNVLGKNQITATYLGGTQPGLLVGFVGTLPPSFTSLQRVNEFDLSAKHWFRPDFGIIVGGTIAAHALKSTGANIYHESAITLGLFFGRAVGLPR